MRRYTLLFCAFLSSVLFGQVAPRLVTKPINEQQRTVLNGNVHPQATSQFDRGAAPANLAMDRMLLILKRSPAQQTMLDRLLLEQQDMLSPNYHKWVTPEEFGQTYGPSDDDIQAVNAWLQSQGFVVTNVANSKMVIEFSGTASQIQQAMGTSIHKFVVDNQEHWANVSDPYIPSALSPVVAGVVSLHNFRKQAQSRYFGTFTRTIDSANATPISPVPLFTFPNSNCGGTCFALGPADFGTIYNLLPLWNGGMDGTGQTIAIVGRTNINVQDAHNFRSIFNLPANDPQVVLNGQDPGINGDESEANIDMQWSGAAAPKATIKFVTSLSTSATDGIDLSAQYIVDHNLAGVMSESYGLCELGMGTAGNLFYNQLWEQAAAQGISVFVSTGDNGSAGCDRNRGTAPQPATFGLAVNGISSTPFNVAVGGTDFNQVSNPSLFWNSTNDLTTQASAKGYIPELPWNSTCTNPLLSTAGFSTNPETNCNNSQLVDLVETIGASGGVSNCTTNTQTLGSCSGGYPKPVWQTGTGVPSDGKRDIPDVSLFASSGFLGSFYIICMGDLPGSNGDCSLSNQTFGGFGGTSVSSPAFAGIMAIVNQKMGSRQGNPNYILYKLASQSGGTCASNANPASTCVFYDTSSGSIAMPCLKGSPNCNVATQTHQYGVLSGYSATTGYDLATGLGSVNATNLVNKWNTVSFRPSATTLSLNSGNAVNIAHGASVSVNIGVAPTSGTGTPSGDVSLVANNGAGVQRYTLSGGSAAGSTTMLPGGTYSVTAHYAGDTTFGASDSSAKTVTVGKESSKTLPNLVTFDINGNPVSFTANSATYGSGFSFLRVNVGDSTASVSSTTGISSHCINGTASCPTGTIALTNNGTSFLGGNLLLNSAGYIESDILDAGNYVLAANYSGDSSYNASSATANFSIAKAPTTAIAGFGTLTFQYGNTENVTAQVQTTSDGVAPTGTFQFFFDGSPISVNFLPPQGGSYAPGPNPSFAFYSQSGTAAFLGIGNHTLRVDYSGDTNYAASSGTIPAIVTKATTLITGWGASPNPVNQGDGVTLSARIFGSPFGVTPTGTVTFSDSNTALTGTVTYSPITNGVQATMPYTPTTIGTHNITATYSGDSNYLASSSPGNSPLTVLGPFSVASNNSITISKPGQSGSTTLSVTSNGAFTGNVSLSCTPDSHAAETTCSLASGSTSGQSIQVNISGSAPASVTVNVATTGPHARSASLLVPGGLAVAGLMFVFPVVRKRKQISLVIATFVLGLTVVSCGGGGSGGGGGGGGGNTDLGTPLGTYFFTVVSTSGSGSNAVTVTTPITVSVQ
ncbi:MAG TPA: Ig-like domain repeat protein [Terriglobales bacterium]|nr:Ig-like domain repeat protein [Terriglobales bacterium]